MISDFIFIGYLVAFLPAIVKTITIYISRVWLLVLEGVDEVKYDGVKEISYYQWTPLILVMQGFLFAFPRICWTFATHYAGQCHKQPANQHPRNFTQHSCESLLGYDVNKIVQMCNIIENINPISRDKMVRFLTNHMDRLLGYRREYRQGETTQILSIYHYYTSLYCIIIRQGI